MIKVENVEVWGFDHAIRGMRNPMNSWERSDSGWSCVDPYAYVVGISHSVHNFYIGRNDLQLMQKLITGGTEHRKFLRQIMVSMDITAPLYWWKEFDTYKIGTVANSCSTMHKIMDKEFSQDDFSWEYMTLEMINSFVSMLNYIRDSYLKSESRDKSLWYRLIQILPESYNQKRTITMNYENVLTIISQREGHKLTEWRRFVDDLKELPLVLEFLLVHKG